MLVSLVPNMRICSNRLPSRLSRGLTVRQANLPRLQLRGAGIAFIGKSCDTM